MIASGKDSSRDGIRTRLFDLISDMSMHDQRILLKELEERRRQNRRKYPRKLYRKEVVFATEHRAYSEFIRDISASGLFIETISPLQVGQEIKLVLSLPNHERPIKIVGEIVRVTEKGIGVKFKPSSLITEEIIQAIAEQTSSSAPRK